jgi:CHAD domain-containing protein
MRTLLRLLIIAVEEEYDKDKFEKILRKLFKPGGKIRETQINTTQASDFNFALADRFNKYLELKTQKHTEKFRNALINFIDDDFEMFKKELEAFIEHTDRDRFNVSVIQFLGNEFDTIKLLFNEIADEKKLHKARMHLKASGYMLNLLIELWNDHDLIALHQNVKLIETMIGDWHDKIVFKSSLQKFADHELSPTEVHVLNSTAESVEQKISESYNEISHQLGQLIDHDFTLFRKKFI